MTPRAVFPVEFASATATRTACRESSWAAMLRALDAAPRTGVHHRGDRLRCRVTNELVDGTFLGFDHRGFLRLEIEGRERVMSAGKHLALMGHFNHWKELSTPIVHRAIRRLRNVGVKIRSQSPVIKHINDNGDVWARMWKDQVNLGIIPYYMFVERDTGASKSRVIKSNV